MHIISVSNLWISYTRWLCHSQLMKRALRIELEFAILLFVVGGGDGLQPVHGSLRAA